MMNDLALKLQAPFPPDAVDFRPQGKLNDKGDGRVVAYVDARAVQDRLDDVFGPLGWSFTWEPLLQTNSAITAVRGTITVDGVVKSDLGDAGETEPSKSAVSDALKRAAVHWGIGRYLYDLGASYVKGRVVGNSWVPADGEVARLRSKLPHPAPQQRQPPAQPARNGAGTPQGITPEQKQHLTALANELHYIRDDRPQPAWRSLLAEYGAQQSAELTAENAKRLIDALENAKATATLAPA